MIWGVLQYLRFIFYKFGIFKSYKLNLPVVSVGNLTFGGTGKTPVVDLLLSYFENKNIKAAVLTRGYGRSSKENTVVLEQSTTSEVGDEPLWLKKKHPGAEIIVGTNRIENAKKITPQARVVILDDGFQHLKIKRDKNIILIDATQVVSEVWPFPYGRGREFFCAIKRADAVFLTKTNIADKTLLEFWRKKVSRAGVKIIFELPYLFHQCVCLADGKITPLENKKVFLFSAIAQPLSFEKIISAQGASIIGHMKFKDHHEFSEQDINNIFAGFKNSGAALLVCTEKDAVKLKPDTEVNIVKLKMDLPVDAEKWLEF